MVSAVTGDENFHHRLEYLIEELSKVQEAFGDGYLSAFPKEHFTRLQSLQAVWAPFYVVSPPSPFPVHTGQLNLLGSRAQSSNDFAAALCRSTRL